jgi:hypothetical protein
LDDDEVGRLGLPRSSGSGIKSILGESFDGEGGIEMPPLITAGPAPSSPV